MKLELIETIKPETWDEEIAGFGSKFLFHQSAWLKFLEETQTGKAMRWRIMSNGKVEGYFAALFLKKGPLKILGSPLPGWTTNYMGPVVDEGFDLEKFLSALDKLCRQRGIHHVELCNPFLDPDLMRKSGFAVSEGITFLVPLFPNEDEMWKNLKSECRNRIRKGMKNCLLVRDSDDPAFVDEYYRELKEVFAKQNLVPTYPIGRVKSLFGNLKPDLLFALEVKLEDEIIATGVFPHDDGCVYFFGGASWIRFHRYCPNELLHWTAMTLSGKLGIKQYNMCGGGSFKPKFGGQEVPVYRYVKSYSVFAKLGRELYKSVVHAKQRIQGRFRPGSPQGEGSGGAA